MNKLEQPVPEEGHIHKIVPESVLPGFILFETVSSTLAIWFPLVAGTLNSCINFMDCLHALSFSKVPLRVMFSFVCNTGMADHCFIGPAVTPES